MEEVAISRLLITMLIMTMMLAQQATASITEHCEQHGMAASMASDTMADAHHAMSSNKGNGDMDCCETECQCPQDLCHSTPSLLTQPPTSLHLLRDAPRFAMQIPSPVTMSSSLFRPPIYA
ncbi:hypothetical protein [Alteromonas antoniana]|uniref:hypothetical protein n=1 Tax=Alteromonas antoniana TaxID=2803813 RepID=UPI001C470068|nr:hypothetical protein [Alteromonas antoniana]